MEIIKVKDYKEMSKQAAKILIEQITFKQNSSVCFATGSTPIGMYKELIKSKTDFSEIQTFNLDEYIGLEQTHPQSYFYFMQENLFKHINVKPEKINFPLGTGDIAKNIATYNKLLHDNAPLDFVILGIGENGHIAFNEPGCSFEDETREVKLTKNTIEANSRFFKSMNEVPKTAVSMGIKSILNSKKIILLASGVKKAQAIYETVKGQYTNACPASSLQLHGNVTIIVDEEAGSKI
ncbi:glucosamine-6-phosphate deaminase [Mycoplasmopsis californica]|uniref:Glucosamine-6-phosphate deaminase n=1 Tax=Mycoplasmopsis equigenitalium TaxID=114883 RepID=A0ABY5J1N6_9BACT|nr:glucosamine-6-phosphate deaminase [Mycoplasmopsis equigenitalium]UUD37167.1 glucosamine-6-phosphate deaminase [Mycoplasmopsis equigenitalium]VEU69527.1 glucosamine-6-phosphate deaminase [Mycoplasmopsis californica]